MTAEAVINFLVDRGRYRLVDEALSVADLEFRFDGILVGPGQEGGLVLVVDADKQPHAVMLRRISAFARVLSRTRSRRPLAAVLVKSASLGETIRAELEAVARLIIVGEGASLDVTLRRLLPLELSDRPIQPAVTADAALRASLAEQLRDALTMQILDAAPEGAKAVRDLIRLKVRSIAERALGEPEQ